MGELAGRGAFWSGPAIEGARVMATTAMETSGYEYQTLINAQTVADKIDFTRRRVKLSWSHHAESA